MMRSFLVVVFFAAILGCSKKSSHGVKEKSLSKRSHELPAKQRSHPAPNGIGIRDIAKSRLQRSDFDTPGVLKDSIATLRQLTRDLEVEEQLSHADALNELFIHLTAPSTARSPIEGVFARAIMSDPEGIAAIVGGLPAGELRGYCVSLIRGEGSSSQELEEIYRAMPESDDRSKIAEQLVHCNFYAKGAYPTLALIQSFTSAYEQKHALDLLVGSMSSGFQLGGKAIPIEDYERVKVYAKSIGQDHAVRMLDKLIALEQ